MTAILKRLSKLRVVPRPPITQDGNMPDITGAAAVILRNAGTATVNLWGGRYTLDSKETLSLNVTEDYTDLDMLDTTVTFDTSTGAVKSLQVIILISKLC